MTARDPRIDPRFGDLLRKEVRGAMHSRKVMAQMFGVVKYDENVNYKRAASQRLVGVTCLLPTWKRWAAKANVIEVKPK